MIFNNLCNYFVTIYCKLLFKIIIAKELDYLDIKPNVLQQTFSTKTFFFFYLFNVYFCVRVSMCSYLKVNILYWVLPLKILNSVILLLLSKPFIQQLCREYMSFLGNFLIMWNKDIHATNNIFCKLETVKFLEILHLIRLGCNI